MRNPYTSPQNSERAAELEVRLARLLLERRQHGVSVGWYFAESWRRQVFEFVLYGVLFAFSYASGAMMVAGGVFAFYLGQRARDLQWWRTLCLQWPITSTFLDWRKIEQLAEDAPVEATVLPDQGR